MWNYRRVGTTAELDEMDHLRVRIKALQRRHALLSHRLTNRYLDRLAIYREHHGDKAVEVFNNDNPYPPRKVP